MYETIKYEVKDQIAYITVNRPKAMNALNSTVLEELYEAFVAAGDDEGVRVIILTGEGKAFVAGADIAEMSKMTPVEAREFGKKGHKLMNYIHNVETPVIAAINGFALGGGCELSMACDIRVAAESAKFGQPEVSLGLIPGFAGNLRLPRLVGKGMAKYMILTGEIIGADEAYRIGLVQKVVPLEELAGETERIAKQIIAQAPIAVKYAKDVINNGYDMDLKSASAYEVNTFGIPFASEDMVEGTTAFLEKRKPVWKNK